MKLTSLSIILPCYNEEQNVETVVRASDMVAKEVAKDYEIIVIDDGSKDKTAEIASNLKKEIHQLVVISQANQGYGGAIKTGFEATKKDWIFFTDADLQFDLNELKDFTAHTSEFDFIFGYRAKRADKFHRVLIAKMLKVWNRIFLGFPLYVKDIDCAFKLMKRQEFIKTFPILSTGAMVNTEFILKLHKMGYKFKQLPVNHYPRLHGKSTGSSFNVIATAIKETFKLRALLRK